MSSTTYAGILQEVRKLHADEQRQLLAELAMLVQQNHEHVIQPKHDITELDGLGKAIWEGVDPDAYVAEERRSWDG